MGVESYFKVANQAVTFVTPTILGGLNCINVLNKKLTYISK